MTLRRGAVAPEVPSAVRPPIEGTAVRDAAPPAPAAQAQAPAVNDAPPAPAQQAAPPITNVVPPVADVAAVPAARAANAALASVPSGGALVAGGTSMQAAMAEQGLEGLDFGFGAFPTIKLETDGIFATSEGEQLGKEVRVILGSSRAKYIFKNNQKGADEDYVYSYDQVNDTNGGLVETKVAIWKSKGWTSEMKKYLEVCGQMADTGDMVILSIPPRSIPKFSGYVGNLFKDQLRLVDVVTVCSCGDKVMKCDYPFYPWAFARG